MLAGDAGAGYLVSMRCRSLALLVLPLALVTGCKREEEVRVYQAPKDRVTSPATPTTPAAAGTAPSSTDPNPTGRPPWVVPEGWTDKPSTGGMRIASYAITAPDGRSVDVSVIPLSGPSGSTLENVNLWRDHVGLGPLTEADLPGQRQNVRIGEIDGELFEMVSEQPLLDNQFKIRTLAAILPLPGTTVFFKATGEDALVQDNTEKFKAWLASVQTGPPPSAGDATASTDMRGPVAPPPRTSQPTWEVPSTWKSVPPSTMRVASFALSGPNNQTGDLSVVALGPAAGGTLANVNRWRNELSLAAIAETELATTTTTLDLAGGDRAVVVELEGQGSFAGRRLLAAIVPREDRTWFYKLTGDDTLVAQERDNFLQFLKSVKYP